MATSTKTKLSAHIAEITRAPGFNEALYVHGSGNGPCKTESASAGGQIRTPGMSKRAALVLSGRMCGKATLMQQHLKDYAEGFPEGFQEALQKGLDEAIEYALIHGTVGVINGVRIRMDREPPLIDQICARQLAQQMAASQDVDLLDSLLSDMQPACSAPVHPRDIHTTAQFDHLFEHQRRWLEQQEHVCQLREQYHQRAKQQQAL